MYVVVSDDQAAVFVDPGAVASFLWGKDMNRYHVFRRIRPVPANVAQLEAVLREELEGGIL